MLRQPAGAAADRAGILKRLEEGVREKRIVGGGIRDWRRRPRPAARCRRSEDVTSTRAVHGLLMVIKRCPALDKIARY